nr:hypothetical protein [Tanacetum cinerariifolium]
VLKALMERSISSSLWMITLDSLGSNESVNAKLFQKMKESDSHQEEIDVVSDTDDVLPPSVDNDDSDEEVDVVDVLRVDNFIQNSEHEYSESEDSDLDNPPLPLPPPEPPDKGFDFEIKISVERSVIVKFECIDARVKFDEFSLLSAESKDTIFDPGFSSVIEVFLCWIFVRFPRSSHHLIDFSLGKSIFFDLYCLAVIFPPLCSNCKH